VAVLGVKGGMHFYRGSGAGAARYFDEAHERGAGAYYDERGQAVVRLDAWCEGRCVATPAAVERGDLVRWVEGVDLMTGKRKGIIRGAGAADRQPLRFVEMVVNNAKSLSIVASQNPVVADALDRVIERQADEIAKYLSRVAVTRVGPRGSQQEVGSLTVETARVTHLTSREGDPHRHVHLMINARVQAVDGTWHGLHSASLRQHIQAVHELGQRVLMTDGELRATLAREGYTLGRSGEIDQAREAVEMLSKRSTKIEAKRKRIEAKWRGEHPGQEPSQRALNGFAQQAWAEDRPTKPGERETPEQLAERVRLELADAGFDFTPGAFLATTSHRTTWSVGQVDRDQVAAEAVAVLGANKSAWSSAELTAAVEAAVTRSGVVGDPQAVAELAEDVRARAAERCLSVLDPEVHTPTSMSRHLTSQAVIDADMRLNLGMAGLAGQHGEQGEQDLSGGAIAVLQGLDPAQGEAVAAVTGTRHLEVIIGPAGTGKTAMLAVAKQRLDAQERELVVVAPTKKAAQVAGGQVGGDGTSLSALLYGYGFRWDELGRWSRLSVGQEDPASGRVYEGPREGSRLSLASVVVVDEAGLTTVDQANALIDVAAETGAQVRLLGDPRQLGAVGRGGVMESASRWVEGGPVTLDEVHRFLTVGTDETGMPVTVSDTDYGELSLALRDAVEPDAVADELVGRGAVVVHETEAEVVEAIAAQVAATADPEALAVTVATNEDARKINEAVRTRRVDAGEVDDTRTVQGMDGERIGAGDRIVTRRNDTARNVANRETWTVEKVTAEGTVLARGNKDRHVRLDPSYVAEAVQLGYATTDYGNQGVTANRSVTWVTGATTTGGLYVGATRGRYDNTLHVVAEDREDARDQLVAAMGRDRADRGLDTAREQAEAEATPARVPVQIDPASWRSDAEIKAVATAVKRRYDADLAELDRVYARSNAAVELENQRDREIAEAARGLADRLRAMAGQMEAERDGRIAEATAYYFAVREDARSIEEGPGVFGRKAARVEAAQARRDEVARRFGEPQLPGASWDDNAVRDAARSAVERVMRPEVTGLQKDAQAQEQDAAAAQRRIAERDQAQLEAAKRRAEIVDGAVQAAKQLLAVREWRAKQVQTMTPDEVASADAARDTLLADQQQQQEQQQQEQQRQRQERRRYYEPPGPEMGRDDSLGLER